MVLTLGMYILDILLRRPILVEDGRLGFKDCDTLARPKAL